MTQVSVVSVADVPPTRRQARGSKYRELVETFSGLHRDEAMRVGGLLDHEAAIRLASGFLQALGPEWKGLVRTRTVVEDDLVTVYFMRK